MTLQKAIEILKHPPFYPSTPSDKDYADAIKLLIEAGKRLVAARVTPDFICDLPLPGETKE